VAALTFQPLSRWKVESNDFLVGIHQLSFPQWVLEEAVDKGEDGEEQDVIRDAALRRANC
jgi:hypothetical protein